MSEVYEKNSNYAVDICGVTVAYRSYHERPASLKESFLSMIGLRPRSSFSTFNALDDISFAVPKGSVLGILGGNGSGKSTLLKVLATVLKPTKGMVEVSGSISSLIELGAGFDPELTAVENIFLNGSLHKRTEQQIQSRVQPILEFAELTEFANRPVKYFSSGMYSRLGFAVAIDINPDILLIDEILAVGDERFQDKCNTAFDAFLQKGKTIIIVSHDAEMLSKRCQSILLLSRGKMIFMGHPEEAVSRYRNTKYETSFKPDVNL